MPICELGSFQNYHVTIEKTTASACQYLCSHLASEQCSGILFDYQQRTCILTSFTGDHIVGTARGPNCADSKEVFYRRQRLLSRYYHVVKTSKVFYLNTKIPTFLFFFPLI